jgi:hypothetical protein
MPIFQSIKKEPIKKGGFNMKREHNQNSQHGEGKVGGEREGQGNNYQQPSKAPSTGSQSGQQGPKEASKNYREDKHSSCPSCKGNGSGCQSCRGGRKGEDVR